MMDAWRRSVTAGVLAALGWMGAWAQTPAPAVLTPQAEGARTDPAQGLDAPPRADVPHRAGVVVVLAGGGAKGFAHLAVLRQLERDHVPIARIVGTSMGAVIGGLYASGMRADDIERVIGSLDPARVALDQVDRRDLPPRTRAYQQQYPINLEFGIHDGALAFARGASDGQRFLALLQQLMQRVPDPVDFDALPIPFRAVATRYRDGERVVFDHGALPMAIRASMAAPGVFAPASIDGETYVDGGLVANLPVEVALQEGADVVVASYLRPDRAAVPRADNALEVANQMLRILIQQNERYNIGLLRPQDILIQVDTQAGFTDFSQAAQIVEKGQAALARVEVPWRRMVARYAGAAAPMAASATMPAVTVRDAPSPATPTFVHPGSQDAPSLAPPPAATASSSTAALTSQASPVAPLPSRIVVDLVRVTGQRVVSEDYVQSRMAALVGQPFDAERTGALIDRLYTSGYFEQVGYRLEALHDDHYALVVAVTEKSYGDQLFRTAFGFSSEAGGVDQFSIGAGYRHPWLTPQGLELLLDARVGTLSEFGARLYQPLGARWAMETGINYRRNTIPIYPPDFLTAYPRDQRLAYVQDARDEVSATFDYSLTRDSVMKFGLLRASQDYRIDVASPLVDNQGNAFSLEGSSYHYTAAKWRWETDTLDSPSFPTEGHLFSFDHEAGVSGARYSRSRVSLRSAHAWQAHVLDVGANFGLDQIPSGTCAVDCSVPTSLYMGGFQFMGAYKMGQLTGDRLAHVYATYMYRLSAGGLLGQKSFVGLVAERGDAWYDNESFRPKNSLSLFVAMDSKIGDIYLGGARGSGGASNLFVQLGRRFSF